LQLLLQSIEPGKSAENISKNFFSCGEI